MYRVLCIEDELAFREDIAAFLRMKSYLVDEASNVREALNKLKSNDYDIILSDIKMPELDGFGMMEALPKNAPPVIFLSALSDAETMVKGHALGCEMLLPKPVNFQVLLDALEQRIRMQAQHASSGNPEVGAAVMHCIRHVLSKPLLQMSEVAYYLTSLPDEVPVARTKALMEMVKVAANHHLEEMGLLQAALSLPDRLPETARYLPPHAGFLRHVACQSHMKALHIDAEEAEAPLHILAQPDWLVRGFVELLNATHTHPRVAPLATPQLTLRFSESRVTILYADAADLMDTPHGYFSSLPSFLNDSQRCEDIAPRMLALLYLHGVAQAHRAALSIYYSTHYGLAVRMHMPCTPMQ